MRWNFGGNLQPVRTICEYDWKECPSAFISYVWSEIVTDVVDVTGEINLWRILLPVVLCLTILRTVCWQIKWWNMSKSDQRYYRDSVIKVGLKVQDLELKINILTYKMQYGTWPLPHEISTPSLLKELRNVRLTLSNTSKEKMWTKYHLRGQFSKRVNNTESKEIEFNPSRTKTKDCKDYEKLIKTAKECRRYMDEINCSNKSLGLCDNSSDISDRNSLRDILAVTKSKVNGGSFFLTEQKKWQEIYKPLKNFKREVEHEEEEEEEGGVSESDFTSSNQMFSTDDERYPLKISKNKPRLLPPGLSITFLSDKFRTLNSVDNNNVLKSSTNKILNKAREKLENSINNSKLSANNVDEIFEYKKSSENNSLQTNRIKFNDLNDYENSSGDNGIDFSSETTNNSFGQVVRNSYKMNKNFSSLPIESDSSTSFEVKLNQLSEKTLDLNKNGNKNTENNINLNLTNGMKSMRMDTEEDGILISEKSSKTELSKDSESDDKSTTTLLREALEFKRTLLNKINTKVNELREEEEVGEKINESAETQRSKPQTNYRSKILDIISEEQSASSSTEKPSKTNIFSREINVTNLCEESVSSNFLNKNYNVDNLKSDKIILDNELKSSTGSSEYLSINNVTENENLSTQIINQSPTTNEEILKNVQFNDAKNYTNNISTQKFNIDLKKDETLKENEPTIVADSNSESEDIFKKETNILENNLEIIEDRMGVNLENNKNYLKMKYFKSSSSLNSDKVTSWNSISESSSTESITKFVTALEKLDSIKSIDKIAEEKLMMLNSTDYEGRNFATAGEYSGYNFNSNNNNNNNKNIASVNSFSDINTSSDHSNGVIEEILEMIADSAIFKSDKIEINDQSSSSIFESNNGFKLDKEKLQRKQDIFSKLKTLDAFTKPLDIGESNSEENENEEEASPLTGRTVVCISDVNDNEENFASDKAENIVVKNDERLGENEILTDRDEIIENMKNACESDDLKFDKYTLSENTIKNCNKKQLSISSTTNFSTDTSESYFDISNHDFAVSSIILTSQNSNFVSNIKNDSLTSEASSSYVDASDYSHKISNNSLPESEIVIKNMDTEDNLNLKTNSLINVELIKKSTSSLPMNGRKKEDDEILKSSTLNKENFKCWSSLNLEKINSKGKTMISRSCIPILKSRIDCPIREKSMEIKTGPQSPVRRSNTPIIQTSVDKKLRETANDSKKSLNKNESYILPPKNIDDVVENNESKISRSDSDAPESMTKECTVIYINIVSDSASKDGEPKETVKNVEEKRSICEFDNLSLKAKESDKLNDEINSTDIELCENLSLNIVKKEDRPLSDILSSRTSNKLMSTSTLDVRNFPNIEKREIEVTAKPSVKTTSTSVSDFAKFSTDKKRSIYDSTKEIFDVSKDLMEKEKIILSEMLNNNDPNFFECKKSHKLYNKLGLCFQDQKE